MCGLPFAGKSTAARALQLRTKAVLVQLDMINAERGLGLDGSAISQEEWTRTYAEAYRRLILRRVHSGEGPAKSRRPQSNLHLKVRHYTSSFPLRQMPGLILRVWAQLVDGRVGNKRPSTHRSRARA
jgi:hypothetical protein